MAAIAIVSANNNDNADNIATTVNIYYIVIFVFGECIVCIFEYIVCCLLALMMEDNNDIDDNDNEEEVEKMEEEL